jgi:hypothetical protein
LGGRDIKLEIPETGISIAELETFLRAKLGNETRLSGDIIHTPTGLSISVRLGTGGIASVSGPESDYDALTQKLAEQVYGLTQPIRYGNYLLGHERTEEAMAVFEKMIRASSPLERALGYNGKAVVLRNTLGFGTSCQPSQL